MSNGKALLSHSVSPYRGEEQGYPILAVGETAKETAEGHNNTHVAQLLTNRLTAQPILSWRALAFEGANKSSYGYGVFQAVREFGPTTRL